MRVYTFGVLSDIFYVSAEGAEAPPEGGVDLPGQQGRVCFAGVIQYGVNQNGGVKIHQKGGVSLGQLSVIGIPGQQMLDETGSASVDELLQPFPAPTSRGQTFSNFRKSSR